MPQLESAPDVLSAKVPSMLLQPLVENAIRHGIENHMVGSMIGISAYPTGDRLEINIVDDGVGLPPGWRMDLSDGLGMRVTQEHLSERPLRDRRLRRLSYG